MRRIISCGHPRSGTQAIATMMAQFTSSAHQPATPEPWQPITQSGNDDIKWKFVDDVIALELEFQSSWIFGFVLDKFHERLGDDGMVAIFSSRNPLHACNSLRNHRLHNGYPRYRIEDAEQEYLNVLNVWLEPPEMPIKPFWYDFEAYTSGEVTKALLELLSVQGRKAADFPELCQGIGNKILQERINHRGEYTLQVGDRMEECWQAFYAFRREMPSLVDSN